MAGFKDFFSGLLDFAGDNRGVISGIGGALAQNEIIDTVQDLGAEDLKTVYGSGGLEAIQESGGIAGELGRQVAFKPFTVTSPSGTAKVGPGGVNVNLSPEQLAIQKQLSSMGSGMLDYVNDPLMRKADQSDVLNMLRGGSLGDREADIFNRLQGMVQPEQERERLGLESRLFNQGRGGVRTAMFGGTPEQLALEKAIQEQQAGLGVSAMEQARLEQKNAADITLGGLEEFRARTGLAADTGFKSLLSSYLPQEQMLASLVPGLDMSRQQNALTATGMTLGSQLAESSMEAQLGYSSLANALRQQQFQGLFDLLKGEQTVEASKSTQPDPEFRFYDPNTYQNAGLQDIAGISKMVENILGK
tara:strand:+ start:3368 stop:4450 length:1083 start_codon:yes stop_codon:yes gene_type:complete